MTGKDAARIVGVGVAAARWLLAPLYLGLGLLLIVVLIRFVRDFFVALPVLFRSSSLEVALAILPLALVLMVALVILMILRTAEQLFAADPSQRRIDWRGLAGRLLAALTVLVLLRLVQSVAAPGEAAGAAVWTLAAVLGALAGTALVLAVAGWFRALAASRER